VGTVHSYTSIIMVTIVNSVQNHQSTDFDTKKVFHIIEIMSVPI